MGKLKVGITLFACFFLIQSYGRNVQAQTGDVDSAFAQAIKLHESGDIEGAIRSYRQILNSQPNRADVRSNLGAAFARLGRYTDAIEQYKQAIKLDPRNEIIHFNLALAYYKATWFTEASSELTTFINGLPDTSPQRYQAILILADCQIRLGENKKALEWLEPLLSSHYEDRAFAYIMGNALISDNQISRGQALIDRVFRHEDSAEAHLLLGSILLLADDGEGSMKELQRAIELNPNLQSVHTWYGRAFMRMGDSEKAMAEYKKELTGNPNDFEANLYLGVLLKRDKLFEESFNYLTRAMNLRPRDAYVRYHVGALYVNLGQPEKALPLLGEVVKDHSDFIEAHVLLASVYYRLNRKRDGDNERAIVQKLTDEQQSQQPGVKKTAPSVDALDRPVEPQNKNVPKRP